MIMITEETHDWCTKALRTHIQERACSIAMPGTIRKMRVYSPDLDETGKSKSITIFVLIDPEGSRLFEDFNDARSYAVLLGYTPNNISGEVSAYIPNKLWRVLGAT